MNVKSISANIGKALLINALFMFISAGVSALYGLDLSLIHISEPTRPY